MKKPTKKQLVIGGITISIIVILLFFRYLLAPFLYNRIDYEEWSTFSEISKNSQETNDAIEIKSGRAGYTISNQRSIEIMAEIESRISKENTLITLQEERLKPTWWKKILPPKYLEYEKTKREAVKYLRTAHDEFAKVKHIEYSVQKIVQELYDYDKQITYGENDKDWTVYVNRALYAMDKGDYIATASAEMFKNNILTKGFNDYILQTIQSRNEMTMFFIDPKNDTNIKTFQSGLKSIADKHGDRIDYTIVLSEWNNEIVAPISKKKDENFSLFLQKKEEAYTISINNRLYLDPISRVVLLFNKNYHGIDNQN